MKKIVVRNEALIELRERCSWTQVDLAIAAGIHTMTLAYIEQGISKGRQKTRFVIYEALRKRLFAVGEKDLAKNLTVNQIFKKKQVNDVNRN